MNYHLNDAIDTYLEDIFNGKRTFELVTALAQLIKKDSEKTSGGGLKKRLKQITKNIPVKSITTFADKTKDFIKKGFKSVNRIFTANPSVVLNFLFKYSFNRMVYYRLIDMHKSVYYDNGNLVEDKNIQSSRLHELCKFYVTLKSCIINSSYFTCTNVKKSPLCVLNGMVVSYASYYMYPHNHQKLNGRKMIKSELTKSK